MRFKGFAGRACCFATLGLAPWWTQLGRVTRLGIVGKVLDEKLVVWLKVEEEEVKVADDIVDALKKARARRAGFGEVV